MNRKQLHSSCGVGRGAGRRRLGGSTSATRLRGRAAGARAPRTNSWATCPSTTSRQIVIKSGTNEVDLVKKDNLWRVKQRDDYPANFSEISGFLLKAADLKAVQTEEIGPSSWAATSCCRPGRPNTAVLVELNDQNGKAIKTLLLGKTHMRKGRRPALPDGRHGRQRRLARWPLRHGRHRRQDRRRDLRPAEQHGSQARRSG